MADLLHSLRVAVKLPKDKFKSIGRGLIDAGASAVITYLITVLPTVDFGSQTPVIMAGIMIVLKWLRKSLEHLKEDTERQINPPVETPGPMPGFVSSGDNVRVVPSQPDETITNHENE